MLGWLALFLTFLLGQTGGQLTGRCCREKTVATGPKAGTYSLVTRSDTLPDFCLGGCVYTKESDSVPGTNYCFQAGQGEVSCSGGGCGGGGDVEGWIEKYFEKQCSLQINALLDVDIYEDYFGQQCGPMEYNPIVNTTLEVFDRPLCEGKPVQKKLAKTDYESFLIRVEHTETWSVRATSEKYTMKCIDIGKMVPFNSNWALIPLRKEDEKGTEIIRTASIDFKFDISIELLPDVFVQSTPFTCTNSTVGQYNTFPFNSRSSNEDNKLKYKKYKNRKGQLKKIRKLKKKVTSDYDFLEENPARQRQYGCGGSGWGSGGGGPGGCNWNCAPTCQYTAWSTQSSMFPCNCRGVVGAGMNYSNIHLPSQATPAGEAGMTGRIDWYQDPAIPPYYYPLKYFMVFAEFVRRNNSDLPVCDSKLSLTYNSPNKTQKITKDVPCFTKPVPPPTMMPTFPPAGGSGDQGKPTAAPSGLDSGSSFPLTSGPSDIGSGSSMPWPTSYPHYLTTVNYQDMFTETEDVLIWGGSDRYWIVGCMEESSKDLLITLEVDFFTSKEPSATPEFCGCIVNTMQGKGTMAPKDLVRDCYVEAVKNGPAPQYAQWGRTGDKRKMAKAQKRKEQRRMKKYANQWKKMRPTKKNKNLWKKINPVKRNKQSLNNLEKMIKRINQKEQLFSGRSKREIADKDLDEESFDEEDEDVMEVDGLDYEDNSPYEMMNDEHDYNDDYNMPTGRD